VLRFNVVLANHGASYDPSTGVFTAPFNGSYLIGFGGVGYDGQSVLLHLVRNGQRLLSAFDNSGCSCVAERNQYVGSGGSSGNSKDPATANAHGGSSANSNSVVSTDGIAGLSGSGMSESTGASERTVIGEKTSSIGGGGTTGSNRVTTGAAGAHGGGGKCAGSASNAGVVPLDRGDRVWVELPDGYGMHNALYHHYASFYGYLLYTAAKVNAASSSTSSHHATRGNLAASGRGKQ